MANILTLDENMTKIKLDKRIYSANKPRELSKSEMISYKTRCYTIALKCSQDNLNENIYTSQVLKM